MTKYTEEMEQRMRDACPDNVVTEDVIAELMDEFEVERRSLTAKYRKMGFEVPRKPADNPTFNEDETATLVEFLENNAGSKTAQEIADDVFGGKFTSKQITGKALSLEMTGSIKPAEKKVTPKLYTEAEESQISDLVEAGKYLEEIAEAVGKTVNSVRGKLLSMGLKAPQRDKKESKQDAYDGIDGMLDKTVAELAEHFDKTPRGVKTVLSRRRLACADYTPKTLDDE